MTAPADLASNAVARAQAALQPLTTRPNSPTESVNLKLYSTLGSELVQDDKTYKKDAENLEKTINALFNENFLALETTSDLHLREVCDCVENKDWERLKQFDPVYYRSRDSLANMNGVLVYDEKIVIPKKLRPKFVTLLHAAHPGQLGMTSASEFMR